MPKPRRFQGQTLSGSPISQFTDFSPAPIVAERAPTPQDLGYSLGQEWIYIGNAAYILVNVSGGVATWELTGSSSGAVSTLSGNSGGNIGPAGGNIAIVGNTTQGISSSGAGSTITFTIADATTTQKGVLETATDAEAAASTSTTVAITPSNLPQIMASRFIVGPTNAPYTTVASALLAAEATGNPEVILIRPGTYIENLTFNAGRITLVGLAADAEIGSGGSNVRVVINGTHTPPTSGHISFSNMFLDGAAAIFTSAAAGSTSITLSNCNVAVLNGHTFNMANWTGSLFIKECTDSSTQNGIVLNNTGSSALQISNSEAGAGTSNSCRVRGTITIENSRIGCPISFETGASFTLFSNIHNATITAANNSTGTIQNCYLNTAAVAAYTHSTSAAVSVLNCVINTSANPAIAGAAAGNLTTSANTFLNNSNFSGTLNIVTPILRGGNFINQFVVSPGDTPDAQYATIQSALDAASAAGGVQIVIVKPGSYTENLTLYDNVQIIGVSNTENFVSYVDLFGQHTPPTTGECIISNIAFQGNPHVFNSNAAGTATIALKNCVISVINGYTFNLPNWNGVFYSEGCRVVGGDNGEINNTGGTNLIYVNTQFGNGSANTATISGNYEFENVSFDCPIELVSSASGDFSRCFLSDTLTLSVGSVAVISNSTIRTGLGTAAIVHNSAGLLTLSDVGIDSSADPCIQGAALSPLRIGSVTFWNNQNIDTDLVIQTSGEIDVNSSRIRGGQRVGRTAVSTTPYVVANSEYFLSVSTAGGAITVQVPNAPPTNAVYVIKDRTGNAAANNITITTPGGVVTFDGAVSRVINTNYGSVQVLFNGTNYEVF